MGARVARSHVAGLLAAQEQHDDLEPVMSTHGRRHYYLRGRTSEDLISWAQAGTVPLVWDHLMRAKEAAGLPPSAKPYISEARCPSRKSRSCLPGGLLGVATHPALALRLGATRAPERGRSER